MGRSKLARLQFMALFMFVMGCVYVGSEQACQVAVYDYVYVYHGLCLCWVGASLPCCSLCLCLSWGVLMLDRSKLDRLNYSSTILGEGSPNYIKTFIISPAYHFIYRRGRRWRGASRTRGSSIEVVRDFSGDSSFPQDTF